MIKPFNILIIEDHELTRFGLKTTFDGADFIGQIFEVGSAEKGIEIVKNNHIDLIILDLGLPNMNGIEAAKNIRSMYNDIKIVILPYHLFYLFYQ